MLVPFTTTEFPARVGRHQMYVAIVVQHVKGPVWCCAQRFCNVYEVNVGIQCKACTGAIRLRKTLRAMLFKTASEAMQASWSRKMTS